MTTVYPVNLSSQFNVIKESTREVLSERRPGHCKVSVDSATDVISDVNEQSNKDCENRNCKDKDSIEQRL